MFAVRLRQITCFIILSTAAHFVAAQDASPGPVRLVLPPALYAVEGHETNVYFDNVTLTINPRNYAFDVHCPKGNHLEERWTFTPAAEDVGKHLFAIDVRNERNEIVARDDCELIVVPANAQAEKELTLLLIGDSLTHASVYSRHLLDLSLQPGQPELTLIGSHNPLGENDKDNRHEGYGGWTALRFVTHFTETARTGDYAQRGSPFLYVDENGEKKLDFKRYVQDVNEGNYPDIATIFLGPNDIFRYTDDDVDEGINLMLTHYDVLIEMLQSKRSLTKVAVMLPVPPAASQDAFGANYRTGQTRWQYKRNTHLLVEKMLERYAGREEEGIFIVPTYVNLDCEHNYPAGEAKWNAQADGKGTRLNNSVHPAASG
ncbi:MAG: SGNH/GDSL hydrolase family protein, partial [Planctomycetaceae bacterium]